MSERSYCPSAKKDALSNKLQTSNREPCDSLRRGLCGGLSSYPRSRLSDHIKNLQRFPDTPGGMRSSLATGKLAVEANAGCRGAGILHLQRPFQERRKPERILGMFPDNRVSRKPDPAPLQAAFWPGMTVPVGRFIARPPIGNVLRCSF